MFDVKRTATVVAKTRCTLLTLTSENVKRVLELFPRINERFQEAAQDRIVKLQQDYKKLGKTMEVNLDRQITDLEIQFVDLN